MLIVSCLAIMPPSKILRYFILMAFGCFACLALSFPPLREQIKDVDMVVAGKLEITREKGLAVTWHPELKGQAKETKLFHLGRIRVSRVFTSAWK